MKISAAAALGLALVSIPSRADAHARSVSYSQWTIRGDRATVELRLSWKDRSAIDLPDDALPAKLPRWVVLSSDAGACEPIAWSLVMRAERDGWLGYEWEVDCPATTGLRVRSDLLFDGVAGHLHFARVGDGPELVLSADRREARALRSSGSPFRFARLGVEHILAGADHLVFLLALVLLAGSIRELAGAVTGFTVGHSATLALAVTGAAAPSVAAVEVLIALSIGLVAVENVWLAGGRRGRALPVAAVVGALAITAPAVATGTLPAFAIVGVALFFACHLGLLVRVAAPHRFRTRLAALFGLVHGFGFASALQELAPSSGIAGPLFGFNLGVEFGQLAVLAIAWPLLVVLRRRGHDLALVQVGSAIALAFAVNWTISRALS